MTGSRKSEKSEDDFTPVHLTGGFRNDCPLLSVGTKFAINSRNEVAIKEITRDLILLTGIPKLFYSP